MIKIATIEELQSAVQQHAQLAVRGGGSKTALHPTETDATVLDLSALSGILEYEPGEYTFTALAGTPLRVVAATLAEHGQYLPFDPPLVEENATLGGTIATGLSGSGRYRYGGVRDFLIGVRIVDGQGRLVRGGGKVVKNAAGFDLPKLMVGSLGQFGVLAEVSFKVFPEPTHYITLTASYQELATAMAGMQRVIDSQLDLYALDIAVESEATAPYQLSARLGGSNNVLAERCDQLQRLLTPSEPVNITRHTDAADRARWTNANEFRWIPAEHTVAKIATTPGKLAALDAQLVKHAASRRYTVGGNLVWIGWPGALNELDTMLQSLDLPGLAIRSDGYAQPLLGKQTGQFFAQRIKSALDPEQRLPFYG